MSREHKPERREAGPAEGRVPALGRARAIRAANPSPREDPDEFLNVLANADGGARETTIATIQASHGNQFVQRLVADSSATSLIVDDGATDLPPGRMKKSEFLSRAQTVVATGGGGAAAEWMATYAHMDAAVLERTLRRELPEAAGATTAEGYLTLIAARAKQAAAEPSDGADQAAGVGGAVVGAARAGLSALGHLLFKRRSGSRAGPVAPKVAGRLGPGEALSGTVRTAMERTAGEDLSDVRIHTDPSAATMAADLNARAFAAGRDIAFGGGEYRPGTVIGDALLAHELAHVAQQRGTGEPGAGVLDDNESDTAEDEADVVAAAAVGSAHGRLPAAIAGIARTAFPRVRSGLRLQRCGRPPRMPTDVKGRYEYWLRDGAERLSSAEFGTPLDPGFQDHFDKRYWDWDGDPKYARVLKLRPGKRPSEAIDALFANLNLWRVDCAHLIQLAHYWAQRNTFGAEQFDQQTGMTITLRPRESTGIQTLAHYGRNPPDPTWRQVKDVVPGQEKLTLTPEVVTKSTEELVAEAPIGSRVRWTNLAAPPSAAFRHENTLKVGPNEFAAGGLSKGVFEGGGNVFTRAELELKLARNQDSSADRAYVEKNVFIDEIEHFAKP